MKATGIVRRVDNLGRIVLPIELRRTLNIEIRDALEIFVESDNIILKKYTPVCFFCGESDDLVEYKGRKICRSCLNDIKNMNEID